MCDEKLIALFCSRDERAIIETEQEYGRLLRGIARNIAGNEQDAEEVVNDTLLAAWESIPEVRPESLSAYLGSIARRKALNLRQKQAAKKRVSFGLEPFEELNDCIPSPSRVEESLGAKELAELIDKWLDTLGKEDRVLFVERYWECRSVKELARERGISSGRLAKRLFRLRKHLAEHLKKEGY